MRRFRLTLLWILVVVVIGVALAAAAWSPLLAWRDPIYILAGFAGVAGLSVMLVQPMLAGGHVPGTSLATSRWLHRWVGACLTGVVVIHVAGLWFTSPPDVIDALLFRSPTPFSAWGVIAMWAVFAAALLALLRRRLGLPPRVWRRAHTAAVLVAVSGTAVHAVLIEGTMEPVSKAVLCGFALLVIFWVVIERKAWAKRAPRGS